MKKIAEGIILLAAADLNKEAHYTQDWLGIIPQNYKKHRDIYVYGNPSDVYTYRWMPKEFLIEGLLAKAIIQKRDASPMSDSDYEVLNFSSGNSSPINAEGDHF